jgi:hypothetical protein
MHDARVRDRIGETRARCVKSDERLHAVETRDAFSFFGDQWCVLVGERNDCCIGLRTIDFVEMSARDTRTWRNLHLKSRDEWLLTIIEKRERQCMKCSARDNDKALYLIEIARALKNGFDDRAIERARKRVDVAVLRACVACARAGAQEKEQLVDECCDVCHRCECAETAQFAALRYECDEFVTCGEVRNEHLVRRDTSKNLVSRERRVEQRTHTSRRFKTRENVVDRTLGCREF